ncbi:MAG: hypothetical protein WCD79_15400 [Chthoniobacteraceae bacterium]
MIANEKKPGERIEALEVPLRFRAPGGRLHGSFTGGELILSMGCTPHRQNCLNVRMVDYVFGSLPDLWPCGIDHEQPLLSLFRAAGEKLTPQKFSHDSAAAFRVVRGCNVLCVLFSVLPLRLMGGNVCPGQALLRRIHVVEN